jgi:hypothetical protein
MLTGWVTKSGRSSGAEPTVNERDAAATGNTLASVSTALA